MANISATAPRTSTSGLISCAIFLICFAMSSVGMAIAFPGSSYSGGHAEGAILAVVFGFASVAGMAFGLAGIGPRLDESKLALSGIALNAALTVVDLLLGIVILAGYFHLTP